MIIYKRNGEQRAYAYNKEGRLWFHNIVDGAPGIPSSMTTMAQARKDLEGLVIIYDSGEE